MSCLIHFLFYCTVPYPSTVLSHPSTSHQPWLWFTSNSHNVLSHPFPILLYSSLSPFPPPPPPSPPLSCPIHLLPINPGYGSLPIPIMSCLMHFLFYCTVYYPPPPLSCPIHLLPINPVNGSLLIPIMSCLIHFLFYCKVHYPPFPPPPPPLSCPIHLLPINPGYGSLPIPIMSCLIHFLFYCTVHYPPSPLPPIVLSHPSTSHQPWLWFTSDSHNVLSQSFRILLYSSLSPPPIVLSHPFTSHQPWLWFTSQLLRLFCPIHVSPEFSA